MKGLIIIGYQGIGKSSCAGRDNCIDLESSNFYIDNARDRNWYIPYCNIAMHLANQGYTVFTSSHSVVRNYFAKMDLLPNVAKIVVFCPVRMYKKEWIQRLQDRYNRTGLDKDYRALMSATARFDNDIINLANSGFPVVQPAYTPEYDLMDYVGVMHRMWCLEDGFEVKEEKYESDANKNKEAVV